MPGTLAEAAAAAPSRAGFGSNPNRSTGRPVVASRSADTGYSSAWAASAWVCRASSSTGLALWSASVTGHGVDWPAKASACGSLFSRSRKKVFMMFLTGFKNLAMCSCVYVCLRFIRALCARHNGWLPWCLVVLRTRFLLESSLSDSMMVSRVCSGSIMASISPISSDRFALTVVRS